MVAETHYDAVAEGRCETCLIKLEVGQPSVIIVYLPKVSTSVMCAPCWLFLLTAAGKGVEDVWPDLYIPPKAKPERA